MFPLSVMTIYWFAGGLSAVAFAFAAMSPLRRGLLIALFAPLPPILFIMSQFRGEPSLSDQYAWVAIIAGGIMMLAAFVTGGCLGIVGRFLGKRRGVWLVVALAVGGVAFELGRQYVPASCLERALPLIVMGQRVDVPPILRPRIEWGDEGAFFNRVDRKHGTARVCRMTRNATRPVEVDVVWFVPSGRHEAIADFCAANPDERLCGHFDAEAWSGVNEAKIEPTSFRNGHYDVWADNSDEQRWLSGDREEGALCLIGPDTTDMTQCFLWQPFGRDGRLTVHSQNFLQDRFRGASVEDVLPFVERVRDDILGMISAEAD